MPSNRTSNDIDFAPSTQYYIPPTRKAKQPPPKLRPLPAFEPLRVEDYDSCGTPNLPPYIILTTPLLYLSYSSRMRS